MTTCRCILALALLLLLLSTETPLCAASSMHYSPLLALRSFGAVPGKDNAAAARANSAALISALLQANSSATSAAPVTVEISTDETYYLLYTNVSDIHYVTLLVNGNLLACSDRAAWPQQPNNQHPAMLYFEDSSNLLLTGDGVMDGQGYGWWWDTILTGADFRPNLVDMQRCVNIEISDLTFRNAPQYHLNLRDMATLHVHHVTIFVNVDKQRELLATYHLLDERGIPTFPLNTDGIDPSGRDVLIEHVNIQNFDDAVAVKPCNQGCVHSSCSQNMTIRHANVTYGVGMTIGSVPPNTQHNCVRNITFQDIHFRRPIKAIYVKSNPGTAGDGLIENILYENIYAEDSLWYFLWIGPQQQKQPHEVGNGCSFLYPVVDRCPTQPRVTMRNIVLRNVTAVGGITMPGVLLCNATNPCTGFRFEDVSNQSERYLVSDQYVCENVQLESSGNTLPKPTCAASSSSSFFD